MLMWEARQTTPEGDLQAAPRLHAAGLPARAITITGASPLAARALPATADAPKRGERGWSHGAHAWKASWQDDDPTS